MIVLFNLMLWATILATAAVAFLLLWEDSQDRSRALRAQHDARWVCACACPGLSGHHSHYRCEFTNKEES